MAVIESPSVASIQMEVDGTFKAARVSGRPLEYQTFGSAAGRIYGHYAIALRSGAITGAAVVAGAPLLSLRWTDTNSQFVLTYLRATMDITTILTAVQEVGLDLMRVTAFTVADSVGTQTLNSQISRMRTNMSPSLVSDLRIATVTLLTAGTRTLDTNPLAMSVSLDRDTNATAGTANLPPANSPTNVLLYQPDIGSGEHPLTLGTNEGFLVRNLILLPAAGVYTLMVEMRWAEVPGF